MEKIYEVELIRRGYIKVRADNKDDAKFAAQHNANSEYSNIEWEDYIEARRVEKPND